MTSARKFDVVVLGAGAAGLMCAIEAGKRGRSVAILERNDAPAKKILISGGGRCNFTNTQAGPEHYYSANPNFAHSALANYPPERFIELVESYGIRYHEKKLGQLFCDDSSRQILDMLLAEGEAAGVSLRTGCAVVEIRHDGSFALTTTGGDYTCESLVVATGGLSIPQLGATDFGYGIAAQFGLARVATRPGLVPFTFPKQDLAFFQALSGVSLEVRATCGGDAFVENLLFTHRGLSGPAILQVSNAWLPGQPVTIDLAPATSIHALLRASRDQSRELVTVLADVFPKRFAQEWCAAFAPSKPMKSYPPETLERVADDLHAWEIHPAGTAGYAKAEVTLGGVDTRALNSKTMAARGTPGLFFIGEVVDVTGWLGGYNFQWAWASGYAAGQVC